MELRWVAFVYFDRKIQGEWDLQRNSLVGQE
jgi:hypothetical protein